MKPLLVLCVLTVCASIALAQPGGQPNSVGIYFDEAGTTSGWATPGTGTVYVLLKNPDLPLALKAWDLAIGVVNELDDGYIGAFHQPASVSTGVTIIVQENDYACAYSEPLVVTGESFVMLEAEFGLFSDPLPDDHACLWTYPAQINPEVPDEITLLLADGTLVTGSYSVTPEDIAWIAAPICSGRCSGVVEACGIPVSGAVMSFTDDTGTVVATAETASDGAYATSLEIPVGDCNVSVVDFDHYPLEATVTIFPGANVHDFDLIPLPAGSLQGSVRFEGFVRPGVLVTCWTQGNDLVFEAYTDHWGLFYSPGTVPVGTYVFRVDHFPYEPYEQSFEVAVGINDVDIDLTHLPIGTVDGTVWGHGERLDGVRVYVRDQEGELVFVDTTDGSGHYDSSGYLSIGDYVVTIDHYAYEHFEQTISVGRAANVFDFELVPSPTGVLTGRLVEAGTGIPLTGRVTLYRGDGAGGDPIVETVCDTSGVYTTPPVPYYDYLVVAWAQRHAQQELLVTVEQPETTLDFRLDLIESSILVIWDHISDKNTSSTDDQTGAAGEAATDNRADISSAIEALGYSREVVQADMVDPGLFREYDLVVLSCGSNLYPLENAALKAAVQAYVLAGGHLLFEGGNLAAHQMSDNAFTRQVLHCGWFTQHEAGDITIADSSAPILSQPNTFGPEDRIFLDYDGPGDSDAVSEIDDAEAPMNWADLPSRASVITYDPNPAPDGGQIVFFTWNYAASYGPNNILLLENALLWLLTEEEATCSVSGTVLLAGGTDHSGITVTASNGGGQVVTGPDGTFTLLDLYNVPYTITFRKPFYTVVNAEVDLSETQHATGVDAVLELGDTGNRCTEPELPILDGEVTTSQMFFSGMGELLQLRVYVDITHPDRGDLLVSLISPSGTEVLLHDGTGSGEADLHGAYPIELTPAESLLLFMFEEAHGDWTLRIEDTVPTHEGTLNAWCFDIYHDSGGIIPVGVQPLTVDSTNGMCLSWRYLPTACDGFNVYRRTDATSAERLNSGLLASSDGRIEFVDLGDDLNDGQSVFYRYAVVSDGIESAFGDEVAAVFHLGDTPGLQPARQLPESLQPEPRPSPSR